MNCAASGGSMISYIDGKPHEADVLDRADVTAHLDRALGPILKRVPELVGTTFTHIYSVSYEGNVKTGGSWKTIKDTFYATMREWAHAHGLKIYSESGGPWGWGSDSTPLDCSQLDLLAHNDFPQGEFWPNREWGDAPDVGHANADMPTQTQGTFSAESSSPPVAKAIASSRWRRSPTCCGTTPSTLRS